MLISLMPYAGIQAVGAHSATSGTCKALPVESTDKALALGAGKDHQPQDVGAWWPGWKAPGVDGGPGGA